jgi:2-polyprenyl-3-methyl-5-hydroxy-6-metoxy-1,4-benzoquinol methylase
MNGVRRIYEQSPYPGPAFKSESSARLDELFIHNLVTPFYLRDQVVISAEGRAILDAGCGTGYDCRILAETNPGARVLGIDFSGNAIAIARQNLEQHRVPNLEFRQFPVEDLPGLGESFDYINCDEVMYMLPDPAEGLRALVSVLKPHGIMRLNFHNSWQRQAFYRAQEASRLLGIFEAESVTDQVARLRNLMAALRPVVDLKLRTKWSERQLEPMEILNNELLNGDRGSTIPEVFSYLKAAGLQFISMVEWRTWELDDLWNVGSELPADLSESLEKLSQEDRLNFFDLLHPLHRLIDFWCSPMVPNEGWEPLSGWPAERWQGAKIHLHPGLSCAAVKKEWERSIAEQTPLDLRSFLTLTARRPVHADAQWLACLYPLFDGPQKFETLVKRWMALYPTDPLTLAPNSRERAETQVREMVAQLEVFLYLLVES